MSMQEKPFYEQAGVAMTCRSFEEYRRMFDLPEELAECGPVLDVAGGASSFTAELRGLGVAATAADPQYALAPDELERQALQEIEVSTAKLAKLADHYVWDYYGSLERHRDNRVRSLAACMLHYRGAERPSVYVPATLPELPFDSDSFGLVVCSHFLFLYAEQFDMGFHLAAVRELVRVCRPGGEVRIYPIVDLKYREYAALPAMLEVLAAQGISAERRASKLPFLPRSTDFLILQKRMFA